MNLEEIKKRLMEQIEKEKQQTPAEFYPAWTPEKEGDHILARVLAVREVQTRFGPRPIADLENLETGEKVSLWLTHAVLNRLWNAKQVREGDIVLIMYGGAVKTKSGKPRYHIWYIAKEGEQQETDETRLPPQPQLVSTTKMAIVGTVIPQESIPVKASKSVADKEEKAEKMELPPELPKEEIPKEKAKPAEKEEKKEKIPPDKLEKIKSFLDDLFEYYEELTMEELDKFLNKIKKFDVNPEDVVKLLGLKVEDGVVKKE